MVMVKNILAPEVQQFIKDHEKDDPFALSLKHKEVCGIPIKIISEQIAARQKARTKLPEWYETEDIIFPPLISMEQCSSETTARYKTSLLSGTSIADLTGGAGVDTFYFSQIFTEVHYVEQNAELAEITSHNFFKLNAKHIQCYNKKAEDFLSDSGNVDNFYIDPARRDDNAKKVFRFEDCTPDVKELLPMLLQKSKQVMIKASPMLDINLSVNDLQHVQAIHIVSVDNECKEVLYLLTEQQNLNPEIVTINLRKNGETETMIFFKSEEGEANATISLPRQYLYEPNASILKGGAFNILTQKYNVDKLHQHTHLYTSDTLVDNFPGRCFIVLEVVPYNKKAVAAVVAEKKANIAIRNFPDSVNTVRKKLNLKEGGEKYLFAFTDAEGNRKIAVTKKCQP